MQINKELAIGSTVFELSSASVKDGAEIHRLINKCADTGVMLARSLSDIYDFLRDFIVCREKGRTEIVAVCALHICWDNLAEIRSLVVDEPFRKSGIGKELVLSALSDARRIGIDRVFVLTYVPDFFKKLGFRDLHKNELPHKIWADCINCPKFPDCDEESLAIDFSD